MLLRDRLWVRAICWDFTSVYFAECSLSLDFFVQCNSCWTQLKHKKTGRISQTHKNSRTITCSLFKTVHYGKLVILSVTTSLQCQACKPKHIFFHIMKIKVITSWKRSFYYPGHFISCFTPSRLWILPTTLTSLHHFLHISNWALHLSSNLNTLRPMIMMNQPIPRTNEPYLIFVTGATGGAHINLFWPV